MTEQQQRDTHLGWAGGADPTRRTQEAVDRATAQWRRELDGLRELVETRLSGMDKATELLAATLNHVPTETDKAVGALRDLLGARIDGMDTATKLLADSVDRFPSDIDKAVGALRLILSGEIRNVQDVAQEKFTAIEGTFASNALALTAALAAQKEAAAEQNKSNTLAINKSETGTKETIAANAAQAASERDSLAREVADLKERLVRLEERGLAGIASRSEQRDVRGESREGFSQRLVAIGVAVSLIAILVNVLIVIFTHK